MVNNGYFTHGELKSKGEKSIADFLSSTGIRYDYEPALMINDNGYKRIWYPDFGLPEYAMFIEYFGMKNDPIYNQEIDYKLDLYEKNSIDVIPIYPNTLDGNIPNYIFGEMYKITHKRLQNLESKIFQYQKSSPGKSYHRSPSYRRPKGYR